MKEHPFRLDPWMAEGSIGERLCMCGLLEQSRFHVPSPPRPEDDASERIIGEGNESGD